MSNFEIKLTKENYPPQKITNRDIGWVFTFIGTAIGAGILFLPIESAPNGVWVFLLSSFIAFPLSYLSLKLIGKLPFLSKQNLDFTEIVKAYSPPWVGILVTLIYSIIFIFMLIAYSTALNNDIGQFLILQGGSLASFAVHPLHSLSIISLLCLTIIYGEKTILYAMEILTIPLVIGIIIISFILIPFWDFKILTITPSPSLFLNGMLKVIPLIAFTVLYYPTFTSMIVVYRESYLDLERVEKKVFQILKISQATLSVVIFFFIFSSIMALTPEEINLANAQNISVTGVLGPKLQMLGMGLVIQAIVPLIGILALSSSFLGVILGAREGLKSLLNYFLKTKNMANLHFISLDTLIIVLIGLFLWITTLQNISITGLLGLILTPAIALVFFITGSLIFLKHSTSRGKGDFRLTAILLFFFGIFLIFSYAMGKFEM